MVCDAVQYHLCLCHAVQCGVDLCSAIYSVVKQCSAVQFVCLFVYFQCSAIQCSTVLTGACRQATPGRVLCYGDLPHSNGGAKEGYEGLVPRKSTGQ